MDTLTTTRDSEGLNAVDWDQPDVIQLESCNSCGSNTGE